MRIEQCLRFKEFMSHSTESVGSNDTSQKIVIGKRKRETDSSASSKIMANCKCPALLETDHYRVSAACMLKRLTHNNNKGIDKIVLPEGIDYWVEITKIANQGKNDLSVERVIALAKEIKGFHQTSPCECYGKSLCDDVTHLGAPKFPRENEISMLRSDKSSLFNVPSQNKRMRPFEDGVSTSQTLERRTPQESFYSDPPPFMTAQTDGMRLQQLMTRLKIDGPLKIRLLAALLYSPAITHSLVTSSDQLICNFLREQYPTEYEEWAASTMP